MKHLVTILMLVALAYFEWRMWPRTIAVYRVHIPGCLYCEQGEYGSIWYSPSHHSFGLRAMPSGQEYIYALPTTATVTTTTFPFVTCTTGPANSVMLNKP